MVDGDTMIEIRISILHIPTSLTKDFYFEGNDGIDLGKLEEKLYDRFCNWNGHTVFPEYVFEIATRRPDQAKMAGG